MQKVIFFSVLLFATAFYSCELSPEEKKALKKSLLIKEQSLQSELKAMNDTVIRWKDDIKIADEQLKTAEAFQFINPEIRNGEIKSHSYKIQCIQKKISHLEEKMIAFKLELQELEMKISTIK